MKPKLSNSTFTTGARPFVVHDAFETTLFFEGSYLSALTPSTIVQQVQRDRPLLAGLVLFVTAVMYGPMVDDWFKTDDFYYLHAAQTHSATE